MDPRAQARGTDRCAKHARTVEDILSREPVMGAADPCGSLITSFARDPMMGRRLELISQYGYRGLLCAPESAPSAPMPRRRRLADTRPALRSGAKPVASPSSRGAPIPRPAVVLAASDYTADGIGLML
jgi:hypothetical protein